MVDAIIAAAVAFATDPLEVSLPGADASPPTFSRILGLEDDLQALQTLDLYELRVRWRKLTRSASPDHLTRSLLLRHGTSEAS